MNTTNIAKLEKSLNDARSIHGRVDARNRKDGAHTATQRGAISNDRFKGVALSPEEKLAEKIVNAFAVITALAGEPLVFLATATATRKPATRKPAKPATTRKPENVVPLAKVA